MSYCTACAVMTAENLYGGMPVKTLILPFSPGQIREKRGNYDSEWVLKIVPARLKDKGIVCVCNGLTCHRMCTHILIFP